MLLRIAIPLVVAIGSLSACAARREADVETRATRPPPGITWRGWSRLGEGAERGEGQLEIVVRSSDRPTQALPDARVALRRVEQSAQRQVSTDRNGLARADSLVAGHYEVTVRALGYRTATFNGVPVGPGCRTDVEVYIGLESVGLAPPPPTPSRLAVTTCTGVR